MKTHIISKTASLDKGWMVFPTVNQLLQAVHSEGRLSDWLIRSLDIRGEYIGYLLKSLLKLGLVKRQWLGRFCLTKMGRDCLFRMDDNNGIVINR